MSDRAKSNLPITNIEDLHEFGPRVLKLPYGRIEQGSEEHSTLERFAFAIVNELECELQQQPRSKYRLINWFKRYRNWETRLQWNASLNEILHAYGWHHSDSKLTSCHTAKPPEKFEQPNSFVYPPISAQDYQKYATRDYEAKRFHHFSCFQKWFIDDCRKNQ